MDKIQIHFNESDYKVYYNYCSRYFQVHDTVRKQSIHTFLDLFEKNIVPVGEQDIRQARQFLSGKCDELRKEEAGAQREDDSTMLLKMRVCSDLLLFCEDLEKLYRLVQKQGVAANYLMILATFSKVIEEERHSPVGGRYDLDSTVIDALARPLAEIITIRLGTDRQWRSVLRELAFIAARFNQKYPEPKFDLDILQLVGPAVVAYFNKDVQLRDLQSELASCFEARELEEFESLLNRTPEVLKIDEEADIDWDAVTEPLKVVAGEVAEQRSRRVRDQSILSDQYSLVSASGILSPGSSISPAGAGSPSGLPQETGNRTFDIAVSPELPSQVAAPVDDALSGDGKPFLALASARGKLQPVIPVIIGVAIILLFIIGTTFLSGNWNLFGAGNTTNTTSGALKNTTAAKATATKTPKATTAKPTATPKATTAKPTATPTPKSYTSSEIGNHLLDLAFGPDNSVIVKPTKDLLEIAMSGSYNQHDVALLNDFIGQFNGYSSTTKLSTNVDLNGQGDIQLYFLPETGVSQITVDDTTTIFKNFDTGTYYFVARGGKTYVNSDLSGNFRDRWILRAVLYNLGFFGETAKYSDSLFYAGTNTANQLSTIDIKALQLMYGRKVTNRMTRAQVKALF